MLDLVDRVTSDQAREIVTVWPGSQVVEVRGCACGQALARKAERPLRGYDARADESGRDDSRYGSSSPDAPGTPSRTE